MENITAYPLTWPNSKKQNLPHERREAPFGTKGSGRWKQKLTMRQALDRLDREINLLGGDNYIVSSNVELRLDGLPRSGRRDPENPAVSVYFNLGGDPICMPCDTFDRVADNIAGIAGHIEATRKIERYGVSSIAEMFTGFAALPSPDHKKSWREVFGAVDGASPTLENIKVRYKKLSKIRHPDNKSTGSTEKFQELQEAYEQAKREVV